MIIQPKIRGFICTTAHPIGCRESVLEQTAYVNAHPKINGPKNVLIIGASTGYGLASRIVASFGAGAKTLGIFYEKAPDEKRTASPGWYQSAAFEMLAQAKGHYAKSINGDAFSDEIKSQAAALIRKDLGKIDLIIYSVASPRRMHPETGEVFHSVLKPIGQTYTSKTVDAFRSEVKEVTLSPATPEEIEHTVFVMGGEDWERWIQFLANENLLADNCKTVAYSYIGPAITHPIYKDGTIGRAKTHLKETAQRLQKFLQPLHGEAVISVNKAVVTQASAAIPVVPLYISILFKRMKEKGTHEGCIEQIYRLFHDYLYAEKPKARDQTGDIRLDNWEMDEEIQRKIITAWEKIDTHNLKTETDIEGYCEEFYKLFGFHFNNVDYGADVDPNIMIPSLLDKDKI